MKQFNLRRFIQNRIKDYYNRILYLATEIHLTYYLHFMTKQLSTMRSACLITKHHTFVWIFFLDPLIYHDFDVSFARDLLTAIGACGTFYFYVSLETYF